MKTEAAALDLRPVGEAEVAAAVAGKVHMVVAAMASEANLKALCTIAMLPLSGSLGMLALWSFLYCRCSVPVVCDKIVSWTAIIRKPDRGICIVVIARLPSILPEVRVHERGK